MSEQEGSEIEVVDDLNQDDPTVEIEDESNQDSEDNSKDGEEDDTTSTKNKPSTKSNWKKVNQKLKKKDETIADLKARLAKHEGEDDTDDDDEEEGNEEESSHDEAKLTRFLLKNPEAVEHEEEIISTLNRFKGISFEEALNFVKTSNSTSETHKDFSTKTKSVPKKLSELTTEEAMKHYKGDDAGFLAWKRKTGKLKD